MFNFFKKHESISPKDLLEIKDQVEILDVRGPQEVQKAERQLFKNYTLAPLPLIQTQIKKLDKNKKYYILCHSGQRATVAAKFLSDNGIDNIVIKGGIVGIMRALRWKNT